MSSRSTAIGAIVIVAAVFICFGRTICFEFVGGWDDGPLIVDNPLVNPPTPQGFVQIWRSPHARMYIPLVYTTWWTLARGSAIPSASGAVELNPYVYHAANVTVHVLAALIVFMILRILVRHEWPAAAGALLFALHPLQVEPVAWATGMKDLLAGMLALAAMWQYLACSTIASESHGRRTLHYVLAIALFILALLAKPSTVVVPFMLLVVEWLMLRRPLARATRWLLPWMALAAAWMIVTARVQPTPEIVRPPVLDRLLIALNGLGFYIVKFVWPARLAIDYGQRPDVLVHALLMIAVVILIVIVALTRNRWIIAASIVFAIALLPTLGLVPFVFQWLSTVADRYAYLALLGPAIVAAVLLAEARSRRFAGPIAAVVIIIFAARSFVQAGVWRNGETLMRHALEVNPNSPPALNQLGDLAFRATEWPTAEAHFAAAVRECPSYLIARDNLAVTLLRQGRNSEAMELMKQTLAMKETLPEPIRQPVDEDVRRIAAVQRLVNASTTTPANR
jgi:hypothetical protein